jgi:phage pi2 protein 07
MGKYQKNLLSLKQDIDVNCGGKVYYIEGHWQWNFTVSFIK